MIETLSPVDQKVLVSKEATSMEETNKVFATSQAAFVAYSVTSLEARLSTASKFLDLLELHRDALAKEITLQMGRPIRYAAIEVSTAVKRGRFMVNIARDALASVQADSSEPLITKYVKKLPIGPVLVVSAWNYPYLVTINSVLPALIAGNTVILKPSPQTPLLGDRFVQLYREAGLSSGVLQCVHVGDLDGLQRLCARPEVRHVCFTGSVAGGKAVDIASATAGNRDAFVSVGLELGGKDPAYVRADADLAHAAVELVDGATFNSGQSCCAVERIYVHESIYDAFVARFVQEVKKHVLGDPMDQATTLGPVVSLRAAQTIRAHVKDAIDKGAKALIEDGFFPADRPENGFVGPQVLVDVDHGMRCMSEETFGPICPIMKVSSDEEAIALMNDSVFGLTASVWTRDEDGHAISLLDRLEAGTVFMNRSDCPDPSLTWTGVKQSGRGHTMGSFGYDQFVQLKSYHLKQQPEHSQLRS